MLSFVCKTTVEETFHGISCDVILCPLYEGVTRNIAFHTCYVICYVNNRKFNHVQNICEKVLLIQMSFTIYNYIIT